MVGLAGTKVTFAIGNLIVGPWQCALRKQKFSAGLGICISMSLERNIHYSGLNTFSASLLGLLFDLVLGASLRNYDLQRRLHCPGGGFT